MTARPVVAVTRDEGSEGALSSALRARGFDVLPLATVATLPPSDPAALNTARELLDRFEWLVFTSGHAVDALVGHPSWRDRWQGLGVRPRVAAVGPATAERLAKADLPVDLLPATSGAGPLAEALIAEHGGSLRGVRVLWPRSDVARRELPDRLRAAGAELSEPVAYRTVPARPDGLSDFKSRLEAGGVDAVALLSPSAAEGLAAALGSDLRDLARHTLVASIGPATSAALRSLGAPPDLEAEPHTAEGVADALVRHGRPARREDMGYPRVRPRRLRRTDALRRMVRETRLSPDDFVAPLFVCNGRNLRQDIEAMPGCARLSVDLLVEECRELHGLGVPAVILFGIPDAKDAQGSGASDPEGPVPRALRALRSEIPDLVLWADVCLCEYTDHGHCGPIANGPRGPEVDNDATLPLLARASVAYAEAGADIVAPSDMMDGRVGAIRTALDQAGRGDVTIVSYAAKYASAFYGPFREAAGSAPSFGDRRGYQMDPGNALEALREVELDLKEGADVVMVKPALAYLDVIRRVKDRFPVPLAAYNVSGEYAMLKAAARLGWLDGERAMMECLLAIRRAGADLILTYFAKEAARLLG
jgi:porphobilinogen synthase